MKNLNTVCVVGAGFGGIAASLRMRAKGYRVVLLERGGQLGGRARTFKQDGHTFDAGPTVITAPHLIEELFSLFNKKLADYVELKPLEHWYRYYFSDQTKFDYVADEKALLANIEKVSPEDVRGFKKLQKHAEKIFKKGFLELGDAPFLTIGSMLKHALSLIKIKFYLSVHAIVSQYIKSEKLRRVFTTQTLLVGGHPFKTSAIYLLILALEREYGCHFCMGGTSGLVAGLDKLMRESGVEVRFNSTVTEIKSINGVASSVLINGDEEIYCDKVIYNGDPAYAYQYLIASTKTSYLRKLRARSLKFSPGLCVYYFGTKKVYQDIPLHNIVYGESYKELLDDIFTRRAINSDVSFYLYRPTAVDPSLAPVGSDSFYALVPVPNLQGGENWDHYEAIFKKQLIERLEKTILPGLSEQIVTEKLITPKYFSDELLSLHGAGFSIQPIFTQSAYFRFHNRSKQIPNLYFVGAGTHPGAGVPGVLLSAKLVDKLIPSASELK
jgi:phytoene desaturase